MQLINGYFIANLKGDLASRSNYYKEIETAQVSKKPADFRNLVIRTVKEGLEEYLSLIVSKKKGKQGSQLLNAVYKI